MTITRYNTKCVLKLEKTRLEGKIKEAELVNAAL